ncbi:cholesterol 24-hydroxylase-like isoform X2 [Actinia tenebrosa]|uniref:Cholesterol 24-hydroxylase-like isoform X2 n=1 Tax=Actinia tenebrosa TaxID=6105 RepID=A0A6P8H602_ACTTE|nr:cholesterol 24-hydroxylase-like isoform X2 [Actinia tenebrosa]
MAVGLVLSFLAASIIFPLFTLIFCGFLFVQNLHKRHSRIPGPKRDSFIWGNVKEFQPQHNKKARFLVFEDLVGKHGSVLVTWDMIKPVVTVSDPEVLKSIFKPADFKDVSSRGEFETIFEQRFLGKGGKFDSCSFFDKKFMERQMKNFNHCCGAFLEELKKRANGGDEVKMADMFSKLTSDLIAKIAFGFDLNCIADSDVPFYKALRACQEASWWKLCNPFHKWDIGSYDYQNDVIEAVKYLRDFGKKVIDSRRSAMEEGEAILEDYLTGQDQLTSLLSNFLLVLFQHPLIEEKLYEEAINVVQGSRDVAIEDLDKLNYMYCVTKETLRLNPPIPAVSMETTKEEKLGGYLIPEKTTVQIIPYIMQTDPIAWSNPKEFNPERFMESKELSIAAQLPYCLRKHCYINDNFAECLVKALFPCLLQKFKFVLVPGQDVRPQEELTILPKDGVLCTMTLI